MKTLAWGVMIVAAFRLASPGVAAAVTPIDGGAVGGTMTTVNDGPGEQTDPHVSGDLAVYTDGTDPQSVRYYRFSTGVDQAISSPAGASDHLSDVSGNLVSFTRSEGTCNALMIYDVSNASTTEIDPQACAQRSVGALGNTTLAFTDVSSLPTRVFVVDISGGAPIQLSSGTGSAQIPAVAPSGNVVVWEQCPFTILNCDIMRSVRSGGVWGPAEPVANSATPEGNADTDGTWIVYDRQILTPSLTGQQIYFKPVASGTETQLEIAGFQSKPSISSGVIAFESRSHPVFPGDIFIYVIATNTMYQVTNTPLVDDQLSDISVLPNGDIRVVWATNDGLMGDYNVYARTFTVPLGTPMGIEMVFSSNRDGNYEIYGLRADGTEVRLTNDAASDLDPALSPDGTKIAFTSTRTGNGDIYVMNVDGSAPTRLTTHSAIDANPAWSPDGTKIAFASGRTGNGDIYVMNANGTAQTRLTTHSAIDAFPAWSPDGTKIAFTSGRTGNGDIYVMNANGTAQTQLTNHPAIDAFPSWSPDGSRIAFGSSRSGNGDVYVMNANGTGVQRLTNDAAIDSEPAWGPSGRILFATRRDGNFEIYVMNGDGTDQMRLTDNPAVDISPHW
jgi:Tol biopolymer transport system component